MLGGVWIETGYDTPVFGLSQYVGEVCELTERVVCIAVAASFSLRPTRPASERSRLTFKVGCWNACWMRASAMPGIRLIRASSKLPYFLFACTSLPTIWRSI